MAATPISTRRDVAVSAYHRTIAPENAFLVLLPGAAFNIYAENALGTDDLFSDIDASVFPVAGNQFANVLGHLIDVVVYTLQAGLEVYIHEAVHQGSGTWIQSDAIAVTPGVGGFERGFRVSAAGWRIRIVNGGGVSTYCDLSVRISTM